jgi:hypothetical protein
MPRCSLKDPFLGYPLTQVAAPSWGILAKYRLGIRVSSQQPNGKQLSLGVLGLALVSDKNLQVFVEIFMIQPRAE